MRKGLNPLIKALAPAQFPEVITTCITHLPNEQGYHAERFEIVKECLESMRVKGVPVLVWDNGSGERLRTWLKDEYQPEYLIESPNLGKRSARAAIVRMLPPETAVGLCDDDMQFSAGWLDASLQVLRTFPNVGVVSCFPARHSFGWGNVKTLDWARRNAKVEDGYFMPDAWDVDWAESIGVPEPKRLMAHIKMTHRDIRITYKGLAAYATAQHCQCVGYAGRLVPFCEYSAAAMGDEREFDNAIDAGGLLRLTTIERYARHMGNVRGAHETVSNSRDGTGHARASAV